MTRIPHWLAQHLAALRVVLVLTLLTGLAYPLAMTAFAQVPGLEGRSEVTTADGRDAGSSLIGQSFTDAKGKPLKRYFQSRPSNAGTGYDATASGAGNQGPESVVDTADRPSLLTLVCGRSRRSASSKASTAPARSAHRTVWVRYSASSATAVRADGSPGSSASTRPARPDRSSAPTRELRSPAPSPARTTAVP
ncbi:potassium-transporting ATPase subunit C [Streptomyces kaempferi]